MKINTWRQFIPAAEDKTSNAVVRYFLRVGRLRFALAVITENNVGLEWWVCYLRRARITIYLWRVGLAFACNES